MKSQGTRQLGKSECAHFLSAFVLATILIAVPRLIGELSDPDVSIDIVVHSLVLVASAYPFQTVFSWVAMQRVPPGRPRFCAAIGGCLLGSVPATFLAPTFSWILGVMPKQIGPLLTRQEFIENTAARMVNIFLLYAVLGTLLWMFFNYRFLDARLQGSAEPENPSAAAETRSASGPPGIDHILERLPYDKRGRICAMSAEQHYVRIYTVNGNDITLMRFSDALAHCSALPGIRIHRSHWVNLDAIEDVSTDAARTTLSIRCGTKRLTLPVSRSYRALVRDAVEDRSSWTTA